MADDDCPFGCIDGIVPCDNCGQVDEHDCYLDGVEYGPYPCPRHKEPADG